MTATRAVKMGANAFRNGKPESANPFHVTNHFHFCWNIGYRDARNQAA